MRTLAVFFLVLSGGFALKASVSEWSWQDLRDRFAQRGGESAGRTLDRGIQVWKARDYRIAKVSLVVGVVVLILSFFFR